MKLIAELLEAQIRAGKLPPERLAAYLENGSLSRPEARALAGRLELGAAFAARLCGDAPPSSPAPLTVLDEQDGDLLQDRRDGSMELASASGVRFVLAAHLAPVRGARLAGAHVLSWSTDGFVRQWCRTRGRCLRAIPCPLDDISSVTLSTEGTRLTAVAPDGRRWETTLA